MNGDTWSRVLDGLRLMLLSGLLLAGVGVIGRLIGWVALTATLGPTAHLLPAHPESVTARLRSAVTGRALAIAAALASLAVFGPWSHPSVAERHQDTVGQIGAQALAVGLTLFLLHLCDAHRPPAAATSLLITSGMCRPGPPLYGLLAGLGLVPAVAPLRTAATPRPAGVATADTPATRHRAMSPAVSGHGGRENPHAMNERAGKRAEPADGVCPPWVLREYGLLADGERGAVVGPEGRIVWLCAPRWHSDAVFSALIGGNGYFGVEPVDRWHVWGGYYEDGTLIRVSRRVTADSVIECRDALAMPASVDRLVLLRRTRVERGGRPCRGSPSTRGPASARAGCATPVWRTVCGPRTPTVCGCGSPAPTRARGSPRPGCAASSGCARASATTSSWSTAWSVRRTCLPTERGG
ncbi:hypothetical protein GCM10010300_53020 [Streptomyces olivaceoviridis]|uniref:trehalase-like domain-containing protein n=1 Tax=Streptomyces olivaceoviridis TaxID=1921 RepID=UPI0019C3E9BD|nr:trehalase-like domain-containing protein [Streptomyces olivaceoviridis]GGZ02451.1 hypothetical protein GCM10010300_53020 [Streptomyces olivaceoviridis]